MDTPSPSNWYDFGSLAELRSSAAQPNGKPAGATLEVAQQFESLVLNLMLQEMRKTVSRSGLMNSEAMKTFEQMFDQQVALGMARAGGIGLGQFIAQQLEARGGDVVKPAEAGLPVQAPSVNFNVPTTRVLEQRGLRL